MDNNNFLNSVYDILAQNHLQPLEHDHITSLIDSVDLDRNAIIFKLKNNTEFELQLVNTYAPSNKSK